CGAVLIMRRTNPDAERPFRCPFVPAVPILGIALCLLLMFSLPAGNWARLFGWLAIGLCIYFFYGRHNSLLGNELRGEIAALRRRRRRRLRQVPRRARPPAGHRRRGPALAVQVCRAAGGQPAPALAGRAPRSLQAEGVHHPRRPAGCGRPHRAADLVELPWSS